tara:strand:- start:2444 stop:3412 length:969 start_codon:yes stop_codon:yes gene_type:complete
MLLALITLICAISISVVAAGYSIIGLATLFAGAKVAIIAMGSVLEIGKLVAASWLYRNWNSNLLPKTIKWYLTTSVIVLVFVTSMGIFGFLSKAHLDQVRPTTNYVVQTALMDKQIDQQQIIIDRNEKVLTQLDEVMDVYIKRENVSRGLKERKKQKEERDFLNSEIRVAMETIAALTLKKSNIEIEQLKVEADVGPLKYIAELIYGEEAEQYFDKAVRIIIIVLIFVFDPLAVLMLIAANISFKQRSMHKALTKVNKEDRLVDKIERQNIRFKRLKAREKDYKTFVEKTFNKELSELDPDEIKLKLNQIVDWNETKVKEEV